MATTFQKIAGGFAVLALIAFVSWFIYRLVTRNRDKCTVGKDCPNGRCVEGACVDCLTNAECEAVTSGSTCVSGTCEVVTPECTSNGECDAGTCVAGTCQATVPPAGCTTDAQCVAGETCVNGSCMLAQPECVSDEQCEFGKCLDGKCEEATCSVNKDCVDDMVCAAGHCAQEAGVVYFNTPVALYSGVNATTRGYLYSPGPIIGAIDPTVSVVEPYTAPDLPARNWLIRPATLEAGSTRAVRFGDAVVLSTLTSYPYVLRHMQIRKSKPFPQSGYTYTNIPELSDISQHQAIEPQNMWFRWVFINPANPMSRDPIKFEDWTQLVNVPNSFTTGFIDRVVLTTFRTSGGPPLQLESFEDKRPGSYLQILPGSGTSTSTKGEVNKPAGQTREAVKEASGRIGLGS